MAYLTLSEGSDAKGDHDSGKEFSRSNMVEGIASAEKEILAILVGNVDALGDSSSTL